MKRAVEQFNGREGETATLLKTSFVTLCLRVGGFAPRHLNRSPPSATKRKIQIA